MDPVPFTNHRPVHATLLTGVQVPPGRLTTRNLAPAQLRKPTKAKAVEQFDAMNKYITTQIQRNPPPIMQAVADPVSNDKENDEAFDRLIGYCDRVFIQASNSAFEKPKAFTGSLCKVCIYSAD